VVEACLANGISKLVHTSSVAAIGFPGKDQLATEETEFKPVAASNYSISKYLAEKEVKAGVKRDLNAVIVNPSVVVGERDIHTHGGELVLSSKRGWIPFYISGGMNIVYVGDVAEGHIAAAERGRIGERYILAGENLTHKEIFERTARLLGVRPPMARLPLPLFKAGVAVLRLVSEQLGKEPWVSSGLTRWAGRNNWFSCEKAKRELGYSVTPFDQTILACYHWYREHGFV
jgi:dihydroflavonol-4-reductase